MRHPTGQTVLFGFLLLTLFSWNTQAATAQEGGLARRASGRLFFYDPSNSGTVDAYFTTKFNRTAIEVRQPHTVPNTAAGAIFNGFQGSQISNITVGVDFSNDTFVSARAEWVLIGIGRAGRVKHLANALNFNSRFASGPGWTSYRYNANSFQPPISRDERLSSLALSLLGGDENPPTHTFHWASRPRVFGTEIQRFVMGTTRLTNGQAVTP